MFTPLAPVDSGTPPDVARSDPSRNLDRRVAPRARKRLESVRYARRANQSACDAFCQVCLSSHLGKRCDRQRPAESFARGAEDPIPPALPEVVHLGFTADRRLDARVAFALAPAQKGPEDVGVLHVPVEA